MKAAIALSLLILAVVGGLVAARGEDAPEDPRLQSGAKRYAAYVREESRSLAVARAARDALGARIYEGRLAPAAGGTTDPIAVVHAAAAVMSRDGRGDTALLDVESHAAGAAAAFDAIRDALWARDQGLVGEVDERIATLRAELDRHRRGDGFVPVARLGLAARGRLQSALDALAWRLTVAARALE